MESPVIGQKIKVNRRPPAPKRAGLIELWAKLPFLLRLFAVSCLLLTIAAVAAGYWRLRGNQQFVMIGHNPELTMEVEAVVNGYERRVTNGDKLQLLVRADRETVYADKRHELDNIFLENYAAESNVPDRVTAVKAVYTPDAVNPENFKISFSGNVNLATRDGLTAVTEQISYDKANNFAETAAALTFARENISGSSVGARIHIESKKLELLNQVEINVAPNGALAKNSLTDFGTSRIKINASRAGFDQELSQFELETGVSIVITPQNGETVPTTIRAEKAVYHKDRDKMVLDGNVEIVSASDNVNLVSNPDEVRGKPKTQTAPVNISAANVVYERGGGKIYLNGTAAIQQGGELMKGDVITADLDQQKKLSQAATRGNAFLRTASTERTTEVSAAEMFFRFYPSQQIQFASATGNAAVKSLNAGNLVNLSDAKALILNFKSGKKQSLLEKLKTEGSTNVTLTSTVSPEYSNVSLQSPNATEVLFGTADDRSVLKQLTTGGRTTVTMTAPQSQNQNPKAADKKMIADQLKLIWNAGGTDLARTEAVGRAELYLIPLRSAPDVDRQSLFADRFDCDFYENNNLAKTFVAAGNARAVLEPTQPSPERAVKNLSADKITADLERETQAATVVSANGNAKFSEADRNATANNFVYTAADEKLRLRGGEPTIWDNQARLKGEEIDWDVRRKTSVLRGKTATTYYSQEKTGGATPFAKVGAPVFIVANQAEFNHAAGIAVYTGNARAWQDANFVRADKLVLQRDNKSMFAEGGVNSGLYNMKRRENGRDTEIPVFAASDRMTYSDQQKLLRYENSVDIKQGNDRITGGVAEVFLNQINGVEKTLAQKAVVVTQPGRRATGDWAQYTTIDETVILKGNPATVADAAQGNTEGRQLILNLRENRVTGQSGSSAASSGRIRSTHKISKP